MPFTGQNTCWPPQCFLKRYKCNAGLSLYLHKSFLSILFLQELQRVAETLKREDNAEEKREANAEEKEEEDEFDVSLAEEMLEEEVASKKRLADELTQLQQVLLLLELFFSIL